MNEMNNEGFALGWDDEFTNEQQEFVLLPEGDYPFEVTGMERARYEGGAKLPPCSMAKLTLRIYGGAKGDTTVTHRLYLHTKTQGLLGAFFESIGQCKRGETFRPRWNEVVGAKGICKLGVREYTKQSGPHAGETGQSNEVQRFLPPPAPKAAPSQGWTQGGILMGQELRPYQQQARDRIHAEWDAGHTRTLLVLPTGTGKTIVFASVAADQVRAGDRVLILAHRGELLEQAADKLQRSTGLVSAVEKAESTCLDSWFRVVVGSVQTLQRTARLERFPQDYFGTIIIDEAHHAITDGYRRILDYFSGAKVLGVTATPDRGDMRNLGEVFDSLAFEYKLTDAIKEGYLCKIMAQTIPLQLDITSVTMSGGDYAVGDLGTALDPYLEQIAAEMARRCKSRKTVVFLPLIKTSQKFRDLLNAHGFRAAEVNGQSDDRRQVLADFDAGKYNVLCNSMLLTEGWDCPSVDCVVVLRPTKVRSLYSQMVGRGTRLSPGKTDLLLLDFLWMTDKHELCRPADLVCEDRAVARQMTETLAESGCPEDIEQAAAQASEDVVAQREEALAKQLAEQRRKKAKLVDPLQYEMSIQAEDLSGYVPTFGWEAGPPSEQQTAALEKLGILPDAVESAGKAALLLDRLNKRRDEGLTTPKQIRCLEKYGFQHVGTWSFEAARHMIDRIAAQGWRGVPKGVNPRTYTPAAEPPAADSPFDFGW